MKGVEKGTNLWGLKKGTKSGTNEKGSIKVD